MEKERASSEMADDERHLGGQPTPVSGVRPRSLTAERSACIRLRRPGGRHSAPSTCGNLADQLRMHPSRVFLQV